VEPKKLVAIRKRWKLTQAQMAKLMAVSSPLVVSQWENGYRNPSGIMKKIYLLLEKLPQEEGEKLVGWLQSIKLGPVERRKLVAKK
jgi:DNA-binding transcriptional regulator YiaG